MTVGFMSMTIVGNVGRDAELKYTQTGIAVCDFSVAVTQRWGSGEERKEVTRWVKVTCWRKLAEIAGQYVKKGGQVLVVGSAVATSAWIGKDGTANAALELTADTLQLLGKKEEGEAPAGKADTRQAPSEDMSEIPF